MEAYWWPDDELRRDIRTILRFNESSAELGNLIENAYIAVL
jgi:hypothetical protein